MKLYQIESQSTGSEDYLHPAGTTGGKLATILNNLVTFDPVITSSFLPIDDGHQLGLPPHYRPRSLETLSPSPIPN